MNRSLFFPLRAAFWLWLFAAFFAGRLLPQFSASALPVVVAAITAGALLLVRMLPPLRRAVAALGLRALVALHLVRFGGLYFLALQRHGTLPSAFAFPAAIGDLVVAALALFVLFAPLAPAARQRATVIWNSLGFADLVFVLLTATRVASAAPGSLRALTTLPLSLLPTFLIPLFLVTHVILYRRLRTPAA